MSQLSVPVLRKRAQRENWLPAETTTVNHASAKLYVLEQLPQDIRTRLSVVTPSGNTIPVPICAASISEKTKRIALARLDLLRHWQNWRAHHKNQPLTQVDFGFISAYNTGAAFHPVHDLLGEVSIKTLYRWQAAMENTLDWTRLVPLYNCGSNEAPELNPAEKSMFEKLLLNPKKPSVGSAAHLVRYALTLQGIQPHSPITFRRYAQWLRSRNNDLWVFCREGHKALVDKVAPFIRRDSAMLEVGQVLVADGHRLNFLMINPYTGKPCRCTMIGYLDWKSYYLAGYEIMPEENTQAIASALRNAIINLGKIPQVCYQDNGSSFRSRFFTADENLEDCGFYGLFGRLGIAPVFAQPYNARAKVIEGWWRHFAETFERLIPSYTGASIADKPAWMARNEKFHRAIHNNYVFNIDEIKEYINIWLDYAGSCPNPYVKNKTCKQVFDEGSGPGVNISDLDDLMLSVNITRLGRNGVRLFGQEYFNEALYGMISEVVVKYSLSDLTKVKIYDLKGKFICEAPRVERIHPMATLFGDAKDKTALAMAQHMQRKLTADTKERSIERFAPVPEIAWCGIPANPAPVNAVRVSAIPASAVAVTSAHPKEGERPLFMEMFERYDWLLKHGANTDEDKTFMADYEKSKEFTLLYRSYNS
ncbi:MAG: transposase [Elusimicrobia bacterium]|nr:transposase [Elusimicrobiota bacterium]